MRIRFLTLKMKTTSPFPHLEVRSPRLDLLPRRLGVGARRLLPLTVWWFALLFSCLSCALLSISVVFIRVKYELGLYANQEIDDDDNDDETTITTRPVSPTSHPPVPPKVIVETSTRTSNGQVVIVESTITVQPSATGPKPVTESTKPPPSLQNAATRQETRGMVLSVLAVGAVMGALLV